MNKKPRNVFWFCFLVSLFLIIWYCFAFYGVAAQDESASQVGIVLSALLTFMVANFSDKTRKKIEDYFIGGEDDA